MSATKDPFTLCYEKLWFMLESNTDFTNLVAPSNRIKYVDTVEGDGTLVEAASRNLDKSIHKPTGFPQVAIEADEGALHLFRTSNGTSVTTKYRVLILTADKRLCYQLPNGQYAGLFPLVWAILRSLSTWETHLKTLNWGAEIGFVKTCDLTLHKEQIGKNFEEQQGIASRPAGWTMAWEGEVEMWFSSTALPPT